MNGRLSLAPLDKRLSMIAARRKPAVAIDPARYAWYDESCPCDLPAGECKEHPRARASQRPPDGDWRVWAVVAGRGWGKTKTGAEWVIDRVRRGSRHIALVGRTEKEALEIMVHGESGILPISAPNFKPTFKASEKKLTWPGGAIAHVYSAAEPDSLRGQNHTDAWLDELGAWERADAYSNLMLGLRVGGDPRACATTTPRATKLVRDLLDHPATAKTGGPTYDNVRHLAPSFFDYLRSSFEGTRLGRQEIHAELLELSEGAWFATFDPARHVDAVKGEYQNDLAVRLAIDCGTSQHTGAVWFQVRQLDQYRYRIIVFKEFLSSGAFSAKNAAMIKQHGHTDPGGARLDLVRLDPASRQDTGIGPAAYTEYAHVFGRLLDKWPSHGVVDGLEFIEMLLETECLYIHPRCVHLIDAFKNYKRKVTHGVVINFPADNQSPAEDMMDALRGGIRDALPEGRQGPSNLIWRHARTI